MAGKKKTNYISYELKKLDLYISQMNDFLDKNPPNLATDRIERIVTGRGESIRVIASIETQVKCFMDNLEKLPKLLEDLNRLRKQVDDDKKEITLRGGADRPGFMDDDEDEEEEITKRKKPNKKEEIKLTTTFDDDSFHQGEVKNEELIEEEIKEQKLLSSSEEDEDEEESDDEWLLERED